MTSFSICMTPLVSMIAAIGASMCLVAAPSHAGALDASAGVDDGAVQAVPARHPHTLPSAFRNGNVYIKVSVNGHPGAWMALDTGTTDSIIDAEYAGAIGVKLTPKAQGVQGFGATKVVTFTTDTIELQVGNEPNNVTFFESIRLDGMTSPDGVPLAGLLGHSFLDKHVVIIDYPHQVVYFDDQAQRPDPRDVAMTLSEGIPRIALTVAGKSVSALIDTAGTYDMIITPATAKELGIEKLMADATPTGTVGHGGHQAIVVGKAPSFSIGVLAVPALRAAYTNFGTATDVIGAGISLGNMFLKSYKLTLNYAANTVRFEP